MKLPTKGVAKLFGKSHYRDFTLEDFQKLFTEFEMTFFVSERISHSLFYFDKESEVNPNNLSYVVLAEQFKSSKSRK